MWTKTITKKRSRCYSHSQIIISIPRSHVKGLHIPISVEISRELRDWWEFPGLLQLARIRTSSRASDADVGWWPSLIDFSLLSSMMTRRFRGWVMLLDLLDDIEIRDQLYNFVTNRLIRCYRLFLLWKRWFLTVAAYYYISRVIAIIMFTVNAININSIISGCDCLLRRIAIRSIKCGLLLHNVGGVAQW